jgi:hypothetical protein
VAHRAAQDAADLAAGRKTMTRIRPINRITALLGAGLTASLAAASAIVWAQGAKPAAPAKQTPKTAPKAKTPVPEKTVTVNDLAAKPATYMGRVAIVGVVGTVEAGKGFVLIDNKEYSECGLSCLTEAGTKKIPVRWTGAAPKVESPVRVDGALAKTDKGLAFTATAVAAVTAKVGMR